MTLTEQITDTHYTADDCAEIAAFQGGIVLEMLARTPAEWGKIPFKTQVASIAEHASWAAAWAQAAMTKQLLEVR